MTKRPDLDVLTFGCRLNTVESQVMKSKADEAGLESAVIVNTCAVTNEAVRQARQAIRRAKKDQPDKPIIVSGCAAQTNPDMFAKMDEVALVLGNEEKLRASSYQLNMTIGSEAETKAAVSDIMQVSKTSNLNIEGIEGRTRAFVQVQTGCDHRCTFCIIPYGRGNSRSVPIEAVIEQVRKLVGNGYREIVLTGVDITSYGADLPSQPKLGRLVCEILRVVPELQRLRISSIDSVEVDEELFEALSSEPKIMPHLHISLQSGDNMILKRMKRRHLREDTIGFCHAVRDLRPDIVFGADIIAGFPTETEDMFANSLKIVDECGLTHLHVFPYSARPGTPAARMPQLSGDVIRERAARLRAKGDEALTKHLQDQVGLNHTVLMEKNGLGRTTQFTPIKMNGAEPGTTVSARITGYKDRHLTGEILREVA